MAGHRIINASLVICPALAKWRGGAGEAEVISRACKIRVSWQFLTTAARVHWQKEIMFPFSARCAYRDRKRAWLDSQAKPALEKLRGVGAYLSDELIDRAIALAGES